MTLRGQSLVLWSVLAGVTVSGCAGRVGDAGPGPSGSAGNGSSGNGGSGSSGSAGTSGGAGSGNAGNTGSGGSSVPGGPTLLPPTVRRLTNAEYDASVQALLGTSLAPSRSFPPDSRQKGGYTLNDEQRIDPVLAKALDDAALALIAEARGNGRLANLSPCSSPTSQGEACAGTFIESFGAKAYRRPLTSNETASLLTLYRAGAGGGTYAEGIDLVTRGILQSAGFLYVTHIGDGGGGPTITLTQHEMASTLSYLVTAGPPDQALLDLATSGGLTAPDAREAEARRLLDTSAGRTRMVRVIREWLGIDDAGQVSKDTNVYPSFTPSLRTAIDRESVSFIGEVVGPGTGTIAELLGADWSIVDNELAMRYGTTSAGASARTTLPRRIGVLNQAAFLSRFAHAHETSPVLRGVAVMRRVACLEVADPVSLNLMVVPPAPDPSKSTRERFAIHAMDAACSSCHNIIDSLGFAFELFDGMGLHRRAGSTAGALLDDNGATTTASTTVASSSLYPVDFPGSFADSNALATALASSAQVRECVARQLFRAASGRGDAGTRNAEQTFIDLWNQLPTDSRGKFKEAIVAFVRSPLFAQRSTQ